MPRPGPRTDPRSVKADEMNNRGIMVSELKKNQKTTGWRNEVTVDWIGLGEKENKKKNTDRDTKGRLLWKTSEQRTRLGIREKPSSLSSTTTSHGGNVFSIQSFSLSL